MPMRFLIPLLFPLLSLICSAQINISLKPSKDQFVAHEPVTAILTITNRAGKTIRLQGEGRRNWLDINIHSQNGNLLTYSGDPPTYKAVIIPAGQTVQKTITLSHDYDLTRYGRYRTTAYVKIPNSQESVRSKVSQFTITTGRVLFSQKVGLPETGNARVYDVIKFNGSQKSEIYVRITNDYTKQILSCQALSPIVNFREPKAALDRNNHLHLLYMITHTTYVHMVVNPSGQIVKRNFHKQGALGEPRLEAFAAGDVKVAGTIPFDPVKERKEALKDRNLSERPEF